MNLSITDFQKISNGSHNAGDITLTSGGKLDKVNNHVGILKGWNTKTVSAAKTLEVKNAFVSALKNAGVDEVELAKVREELGLPQGDGTKGFDLSGLKPLTRAQTREILDRFAGVINEKAKRIVVSNRWESLKSGNAAGYQNLLARTAEVNNNSAAARAAEQRKLGKAIMDNGSASIPSGIRKSATYRGLTDEYKQKFEKLFTYMLMRGGADVNSLAAEAMRKTLVAAHGNEIRNAAERDLFKAFAYNHPATSDLARLEQEVKEAKKSARSARDGLKLEFGSNTKEMKNIAYFLRTTGGLGFNVNETAKTTSNPDDFADNLAKRISKNEPFLKDILAKFSENVKDIGSLELLGRPDCKITTLENGNVQLVFDIKAGIAGGKAFAGDCFVKVEVDPAKMTLENAACSMKIAPSKFTNKDDNPVEIHKLQILKDVRDKGIELESPITDDEFMAIFDQMSKWDDMKPGQMKNFEKWLKNDISSYIADCIAGKDPTGDNAMITFDEKGLASQFKRDYGRTQVKIGGTLFAPQEGENTMINDEICKALPNISDRRLITAIMNQSSVATISLLVQNSVDPKRENEPNAPTLRSMDPAGEHVANCDVNKPGDLMYVMQPKNLSDSRYELEIDDKKKTATITLALKYDIKPGVGFHEGLFAEGAWKPGVAGYTYQFTVTGLGSGNPQIASVGFAQEITSEAEEM